MNTPHWKQLGFLTPDAMECQQDVWALQARLRDALGDVLADLCARTAEPTWAASLEQAAGRCRLLADALGDEAGTAARERIETDDVLREFDAVLEEVTSSGHVPSLITTGYSVLGELSALPIRLLEDVAGPHARLLCGRISSDESHRLLGRLFPITQPGARDKENLRRLLRHLHGHLFTVYESWRQTFHTLGVDGEHLGEDFVATVRTSHETLGLRCTRADVGFTNG